MKFSNPLIRPDLPRRITVDQAWDGFELFSDPALAEMRMGFWHDKPRDGEIELGCVSVRAQDPDIPFFGKLKES